MNPLIRGLALLNQQTIHIEQNLMNTKSGHKFYSAIILLFCILDFKWSESLFILAGRYFEDYISFLLYITEFDLDDIIERSQNRKIGIDC